MQLPYHDRYAYSPIVDRPHYSWPDGKRLAVYLGLNIEHFAFGAGEGHLLTVAGAAPDPRTFAWRDYGNRVGVWRCLELFDELNLPAAHLINTAVFDYAPRIVDALKARGDEFIGHGRTNAERHSHMWEADERRFLALHTMIVGQPYRLRMLREALQHIVSHPEKEKVWFTRPSAIYGHCAALPADKFPPA